MDLIGPWRIQVCVKPHKFEACDVPIQDPKVKNPSQDPKPRFQTKNTSLIVVVFFFVCLFASFTNSRMENDSQKCHIRDVCTIAKNPQDMASAKKYINEALSIAMHAMKAAIHSTLGSSPGSLTFNRDMFLNIPLISDWHTITQRQEHLLNENLIGKNQKHRQYDYVPQQRELKKKWKPCKLGERTSGSYKILQTHVNGTLTIELQPGISERLNIRRVIPYKEPTDT